MLQRVAPLMMILALLSCRGSQTPDGTMGAEGRAAYELPPEAESLEAPEATPDASEADTVAPLKVAGVNLLPTTNIFVAGVTYVGDPLPVMALIQSDSPDICRHLQEGTMPKGSGIFAAVILQWDGKPYRVGRSYPGQAYSGREQAPYVQGFLRKLDATCGITPAGPLGVGLELNYGALVLRSYEPNKRVVADYKLRVEADSEALEGHIDAAFCDAPMFFETPEMFLMPVDPDKCR